LLPALDAGGRGALNGLFPPRAAGGRGATCPVPGFAETGA
jgi:hypothetical protein